MFIILLGRKVLSLHRIYKTKEQYGYTENRTVQIRF